MIMPLTITKLKMWKDPGYTRECVEVPPRGSWKMPAADYVSSENLRPRKGSTLTAVELPLPYLQVMDMSYLYIEVEDGVTPTPNTVKLFGWIVSIEELASSNENVRITWTVDYWRTYSQDAVFGAGTITRCGDGTYKRPYVTQPRKWLIDTAYQVSEYEGNYFILAATEGSGATTKFAYYFGPIEPTFEQSTWGGMTASELWSGKVTERLNLDPDNVVGCWMIPENPIHWSTAYAPFDPNHPDYEIYKSYGFQSVEWSKSLPEKSSDDLSRAILINPFGNIDSELPWGFSLGASTPSSVKALLNVSTESVDIYYYPTGEGTKALATGHYLIAHGVNIPILSNAWASYNYSGQRSYDKRLAEIQRNQQAVSGFSSVGSSMVGGAIAGATKGSVGGALAGAAAGGASSIIGTTVNYFAQGWFNDELQKETDKLVSNQAVTVNLGGSGQAWEGLNRAWSFVQMKGDAVSLAEYSSHITNDGYTVEIPVSNATSFITAGGALQIQNLMLTGDIPPAGKSYIKNILSNGVRIVENNPTGVNP